MIHQFICSEIDRLRLHVEAEEIQTLRRFGIGTASAELLLVRMQASVEALRIKRDKLVGEHRIRLLRRAIDREPAVISFVRDQLR